MRAELLALARRSPHPAVPATFSPREKERRPRRACNSTVKRARLNRFASVKQFSRVFKQIHGLPLRELAARTLRATKARGE